MINDNGGVNGNECIYLKFHGDHDTDKKPVHLISCR